MPSASSGAPAAGVPATKVPRRGFIVLFAGLVSNFSIGILYTWSNIRDVVETYAEWSVSQLTIPFSIGGLTFAATLIIAGALQDRFGPRPVMIAGTLAVGGGTILSGMVSHNPGLFFITFGVIIGTGMGFTYACPRPAAMKWFDPSKKGMINGIVVTGFGLSAVWMGPVQVYMLNTLGYSLERMLITLGAMILLIGLPASAAVVDPPAGYVPPLPKRDDSKPIKETFQLSPSVALKTTIRTKQAWMLLAVFALYCSAGSAIISSVGSILRTQTLGGETGPYAVQLAALLGVMVPITAIANAIGRPSGGIGSDFLGRRPMYFILHAVNIANLLAFSFYKTPTMIAFGAVVTVMLYGAGLSVMPSIVADYFGLKNYGANYGFVFFGWGLSLLIGPQIGSSVLAATGSYNMAYLIAAGLLSVSFLLVVLLRKPEFSPEQIVDEAPLAAAGEPAAELATSR